MATTGSRLKTGDNLFTQACNFTRISTFRYWTDLFASSWSSMNNWGSFVRIEWPTLFSNRLAGYQMKYSSTPPETVASCLVTVCMCNLQSFQECTVLPFNFDISLRSKQRNKMVFSANFWKNWWNSSDMKWRPLSVCSDSLRCPQRAKLSRTSNDLHWHHRAHSLTTSINHL